MAIEEGKMGEALDEMIGGAGLGWGTRKVTYAVSDLKLAGYTGVIAQNQVIGYFHRQNPELIVQKATSFKMNPQDQTVTLVVKVVKRSYTMGVDVAASEDKTAATIHTFNTAKPITDPARLLLEGTPLDSILEQEHGVCCAGYNALENENAALKTAIKYALDDLPQSPDSAKRVLEFVVEACKENRPGTEGQNGN